MRTQKLLLLPFSITWTFVKILFWPALILTLFWWLAPHSWAVTVTWFVGGYLLIVLWFWRRVLRGQVRSMSRGTVLVKPKGGRR